MEHMWAAMNRCTASFDVAAITASYDISCQYAHNQALLENQAAVDAAGDAGDAGNVEGAGGGSEN